jgi:hypothetical protein
MALGVKAVGVIAALGHGVDRWSVGDDVLTHPLPFAWTGEPRRSAVRYVLRDATGSGAGELAQVGRRGHRCQHVRAAAQMPPHADRLQEPRRRVRTPAGSGHAQRRARLERRRPSACHEVSPADPASLDRRVPASGPSAPTSWSVLRLTSTGGAAWEPIQIAR